MKLQATNKPTQDTERQPPASSCFFPASISSVLAFTKPSWASDVSQAARFRFRSDLSPVAFAKAGKLTRVQRFNFHSPTVPTVRCSARHRALESSSRAGFCMWATGKGHDVARGSRKNQGLHISKPKYLHFAPANRLDSSFPKTNMGGGGRLQVFGRLLLEICQLAGEIILANQPECDGPCNKQKCAPNIRKVRKDLFIQARRSEEKCDKGSIRLR